MRLHNSLGAFLSKRALVVDPSQDMRELIRSVLLSQHFVVDAVADPAEVASAEAREYAVVIADVPFGEATTRFADRLHAEFSSVGAGVVLMTADRDDAPALPADSELLLKPFDRSSLVAAVKHATAG